MFLQKLREITAAYPDNPAVLWRGDTMSYAELDELSDRFAAELISQGVKPCDIVPVTLPRGAEFIAYTIGVMKTGASYAPVSSELPAERRNYILNDLKSNKTSADGMLIYYTSGSTGVPKGTVLTRSGVTAHCEAHVELFGLSHGVRSGVQADVGFDSFLLSTLPILYCGGTLCLMDDTERYSLVGIHRFLLKNKIDILFLTTQVAVEYMRAFDNKRLKILIAGGEALRTYIPRSYDAYNIYGPTECTAYVTAHKLGEHDSGDIPIGAPVGKNRIIIIDGELCVSGPQVAEGYLGKPDSDRFVPNPHYIPGTHEPCYARMYKTGDLAEWTKDGKELLYRGRIDNQVKISGYRIEPGEIEIALSKHSDLLSVCVAVRHTPDGDAFLAAYYVPRTENVSTDGLKEFLLQRLPSYMLPKKFVPLRELPLNARTGKVDTSALPEPYTNLHLKRYKVSQTDDKASQSFRRQAEKR